MKKLIAITIAIAVAVDSLWPIVDSQSRLSVSGYRFAPQTANHSPLTPSVLRPMASANQNKIRSIPESATQPPNDDEEKDELVRKSVNTLINNLNNANLDISAQENWIVLRSISRQLGYLGARATAYITERLNASILARRSTTIKCLVMALGNIGPGAIKAAPTMIRALKKLLEEEQDIDYYAMSLGNLGPEACGSIDNALNEAIVKREWNLAFYLIQALGFIGKKAVPSLNNALIEVMKAEEWRLTAHINITLDKIGENTISNLIHLLKESVEADNRNAVKHISTALTILGSPSGIISRLSTASLNEWITLGATLYLEGGDKWEFAATTDPALLAKGIKQHLTGPGDLHISLSFYLAGPFSNRCRFIATTLFITSVHMERFRSLGETTQRITDVIPNFVTITNDSAPLKTIHHMGPRIQYFVEVDNNITEGNLELYLRFIQMLNLGLLLGSGLREYQRVTTESHPVLTEQHRAIIRIYENFESMLVRILREFDSLKCPKKVYAIPGLEDENKERREALGEHSLDEVIYPDKPSPVELNLDDSLWDRLLPCLRAVEAFMLQGDTDEEKVPLGDQLIHKTRKLFYDSGSDIADIVAGKKNIPDVSDELGREKDPFLDCDYEGHSIRYACAMLKAIRDGAVKPEVFPSIAGLKFFADFREPSTHYISQKMLAAIQESA